LRETINRNILDDDLGVQRAVLPHMIEAKNMAYVNSAPNRCNHGALFQPDITRAKGGVNGLTRDSLSVAKNTITP